MGFWTPPSVYSPAQNFYVCNVRNAIKLSMYIWPAASNLAENENQIPVTVVGYQFGEPWKNFFSRISCKINKILHHTCEKKKHNNAASKIKQSSKAKLQQPWKSYGCPLLKQWCPDKMNMHRSSRELETWSLLFKMVFYACTCACACTSVWMLVYVCVCLPSS